MKLIELIRRIVARHRARLEERLLLQKLTAENVALSKSAPPDSWPRWLDDASFSVGGDGTAGYPPTREASALEGLPRIMAALESASRAVALLKPGDDEDAFSDALCRLHKARDTLAMVLIDAYEQSPCSLMLRDGTLLVMCDEADGLAVIPAGQIHRLP